MRFFFFILCSSLFASDYSHFLQTFLQEHPIHTVVDLDGKSQEGIDWTGIDYLNCASSCDLPEADLLLCKDVLHSLSNDDILTFISQLSKFKYCLITNSVYPGVLTSDNAPGFHRTLDLRMRPFRLPLQSLLHYTLNGRVYQVALFSNE